MKILYLHQYFKFPDESGGTRSFDLAAGFLKLGYEVEVVSGTSRKDLISSKRWTAINKDNITIHYIYLPYDNQLPYFKRILVFFRFIWHASFKLFSLNADLVLATSTPLTIGIPALLKKWIHSTPFIFEVRDVWPEAVIAIGVIKNKFVKRVLFFLERTIYKNARGLVPLSLDMKTSIQGRFSKILESKPIQVIENISEVNRFQNGYSTQESIIEKTIGFKPRFCILYAGTFGRVNGIDYVINLAARTKEIDDSIVYILIGEGALKAEVIKQATEKQLLNFNVFILNSIAKQELPQWYHESSMGSSFVIPVKELWANSANKFFDTLAAGKPILINHQGWQKDTIEKENIGYVLPEITTDEAVMEFVKYTQNKKLLEEQQKNALRLAIKEYSLDVAVEKYIKLFNSIHKN